MLDFPSTFPIDNFFHLQLIQIERSGGFWIRWMHLQLLQCIWTETKIIIRYASFYFNCEKTTEFYLWTCFYVLFEICEKQYCRLIKCLQSWLSSANRQNEIFLLKQQVSWRLFHSTIYPSTDAKCLDKFVHTILVLPDLRNAVRLIFATWYQWWVWYQR